MISEDEAIRIAKSTIEGSVELPDDVKTVVEIEMI